MAARCRTRVAASAGIIRLGLTPKVGYIIRYDLLVSPVSLSYSRQEFRSSFGYLTREVCVALPVGH